MSDRLQEIRARLDEWQSVDLNEHERRGVHAYEGMAADIAWLLDEVERVTNERDIAKKWFHRWRRAAWEARARKAAE